MSENVLGWTFDGVTQGPWNENAAQVGCSSASWFGWKPNNLVGSISTILNGYGSAILGYGNCNSVGRVAVYKNDVEIASVGAKIEDQLEFEFQDGDVINISEENMGIIQFNDLAIIGCGSGIDF